MSRELQTILIMIAQWKGKTHTWGSVRSEVLKEKNTLLSSPPTLYIHLPSPWKVLWPGVFVPPIILPPKSWIPPCPTAWLMVTLYHIQESRSLCPNVHSTDLCLQKMGCLLRAGPESWTYTHLLTKGPRVRKLKSLNVSLWGHEDRWQHIQSACHVSFTSPSLLCNSSLFNFLL
jgi:hypothetical protein